MHCKLLWLFSRVTVARFAVFKDMWPSQRSLTPDVQPCGQARRSVLRPSSRPEQWVFAFSLGLRVRSREPSDPSFPQHARFLGSYALMRLLNNLCDTSSLGRAHRPYLGMSRQRQPT